MNIKYKLPAILAVSGILVIAAGVHADMQGICLRNDPAWTYIEPPACSSDAQCIEEKHTTGSSCQYGPFGWCISGTAYAPYYTRNGTCVAGACDFTYSVWSEITSDPDIVPTCADGDSSGGEVTN